MAIYYTHAACLVWMQLSLSMTVCYAHA